MMKKELIPSEEHELVPIRKSVTSGVSGMSLIPKDVTGFKVTLTHVSPGGKFHMHEDEYHHVFYVVSGNGEICLENETHTVGPGTIVRIPSKTLHGYQNTSNQLLKIIMINIPAT